MESASVLLLGDVLQHPVEENRPLIRPDKCRFELDCVFGAILEPIGYGIVVEGDRINFSLDLGRFPLPLLLGLFGGPFAAAPKRVNKYCNNGSDLDGCVHFQASLS